MSAPAARLGRYRERQRWVGQLPLVFGLAGLWCLLWDDVSWANAVNGLLLAFVVTRVLYLPAVRLEGRFNAYWAASFLINLGFDVARSSGQVVKVALRRRCAPQNAVVGVRLHTGSDLLMTVTSLSLSLMPGSLILEVDRRNATLYLHLLDARSDAEVEHARRDILRLEERLIRAIGSREEVRTLDAERAASGRPRRGRWGR